MDTPKKLRRNYVSKKTGSRDFFLKISLSAEERDRLDAVCSYLESSRAIVFMQWLENAERQLESNQNLINPFGVPLKSVMLDNSLNVCLKDNKGGSSLLNKGASRGRTSALHLFRATS